MSDLSSSRYSSHRGSGQQRSPARSPASRTSLTSASSFPMAPIATWPRATTTAPVSVAMSSTAAGLKRRTNDSASHRIRRPSASVLMISIVLPKWLFTTSPGFTAVPDGRFSVAGMRPTTLSFGLRAPSTSNVPSTAAAPDMSNFMSSMFCAGLIEIPPESNVTPFPTRTMGGAASPAPRYSSTMKRGSCSVPCATASSAPMPPHRAQILSRHAVPRLARHGEGEVLRTCTQRPRPLRRHGGGSPDGAAGYLARLPQADEQHALRLAVARVEQRALVPLALEVTARDGPAHHTAHRAVQLDERWGNRAALRERQGEERGGDLREGGGDDRTVHLRHARLCTRRRRRSRPRWRRASGGPGRK